MTRVLIVDDDPAQLRLLARVLSMRRRDLTVLTASHGGDAIEVLKSGPVDLVLTDLQMPDVNGFDLLAWILSNQPHVPAYSMTAYPDSEAMGRLSDLGSLECFTKPLDIDMLLDRVSRVLADGARGHVSNIGLPSFLQLLEMERKTCTLTVESLGRTGYLYLSDGVLVAARTPEHEGEQAATSIVAWPNPVITILAGCAEVGTRITTPLGFIIMEGMRLADEASREAAAQGPHQSGAIAMSPTTLVPNTGPRSTLSSFPMRLPADARAIAIVESENGRVRTAAGQFEGLDSHAEFVARTFAAESAIVERLGLDDDVREMVITTKSNWTLVRPLHSDPGSLAMLIFDPDRANLAMERLALANIVRELEEWFAPQMESVI